jgi:MSHA biogenesis protein MshK
VFKFITLLVLATALPVSASGESLRDPTRPLGYRSAPTAQVELELNSILIGGTRKLAVINGQQLRENDVIQGSGGVRLRAIEPQAVVLQQGTRTWRVRLAGNGVRRTAPTEN